jgi:hypothetical protein
VSPLDGFDGLSGDEAAVPDRITICHWHSNGWSQIMINPNGLSGHAQHTLDVWPPVPGTTPGQNWPAGEGVYLAGCALAPEPTSSASASASPMPSVTPPPQTDTPSASVTPSVTPSVPPTATVTVTATPTPVPTPPPCTPMPAGASILLPVALTLAAVLGAQQIRRRRGR